MKRLAFIICGSITIALIVLIIFRIKTGNTSSRRLDKQLMQIAHTLTQVKTRSVGFEQFNQMVQARVGTNVDSLSETERAKLFSCIGLFYITYSSGNFDEYKQFRLHQPFSINEKLVSFVKGSPVSKGRDLKSDEEILHVAWDIIGSTNKISQIDDESIHLSIVSRSDLGTDLEYASDASKWPAFATATCKGSSILYKPSLNDLLKKEGTIRYFRLELKARFNSETNLPAVPLVLVGYWDSTRQDWMPNALCSWVGLSNTEIFF